MTDEQRIWLDHADRMGGSFISAFAEACIRADDENFKLLEPVLNALMIKYPKYLKN